MTEHVKRAVLEAGNTWVSVIKLDGAIVCTR
jgi:hypothetical protein